MLSDDTEERHETPVGCFAQLISNGTKCDRALTTEDIYEPRHDKTRLRKFPTRPDTNRPAQPQKLARVLKFRL